MQPARRATRKLPPHERLALARVLLDLDQSGHDVETQNAWDTEIQARSKAVDEGRVAGIPYEQIKKEMELFGQKS